MKRRIAILLPSLSGGGIERVMLNVAIGLMQRDFVVDLVLVQASGPLLSQVPESIRVVDLRGRKTILALPSLVAYLRRERPACVVSALECVNLINLWARRLSAVPYRCIVTTHTTVSKDFLKLPAYKRWLGLLLMRLSYRGADMVLAVSAGAAKDLATLIRLPDGFVRVARNPVVTPELFAAAGQPPTHPWLAPVKEAPVVLGIGRLSDEKDFATLIKAFALACQDDDCRLMILGEGPCRSGLERLIAELGLQERVDLVGFQANPYAYLARVDLFVLSSRYEGLPTALVEALALGIPVVSTDCQHGPDEILRGGAFGRLVPVGDVERMAMAIRGALAGANADIPDDAWRAYEFDRAVEHYAQLLG